MSAGFAAIKGIWKKGALKFVRRSDGAAIFTINASGPGRGGMAVVDIDAQNGDITTAAMKTGLIVHSSTTAGGTITSPDATTIDAAFPDWEIGEERTMEYLNDGNQTVTLTGATGVTRLSAQTIATLQGRTFHWLKTATSTYILWGS